MGQNSAWIICSSPERERIDDRAVGAHRPNLQGSTRPHGGGYRLPSSCCPGPCGGESGGRSEYAGDSRGGCPRLPPERNPTNIEGLRD